MPTGARNFYLATAKPTLDEFYREPLDLRRGRLAAIVLFHVADYLFLDVPSRSLGIFEASLGTAMFGEASIAMVTLDDQTSRPLLGILRSVSEFWETDLPPESSSSWI